MRSRTSLQYVLLIALFGAIILIGSHNRQRDIPHIPMPRAVPAAADPLGGKGLVLLLERLGYTVATQSSATDPIAAGTRVWIWVDPESTLSKRQVHSLLQWVERGGILIFAPSVDNYLPDSSTLPDTTGMDLMKRELNVKVAPSGNPGIRYDEEPLPILSPLQRSAISSYWSGVSSAQASSGLLNVGGNYLEIAGTSSGAQVARLDRGKGHIFVLPDALLLTNYGLAQADNAVFVTNLIRLHANGRDGSVCIDQRHTQLVAGGTYVAAPTLTDYLWRPPVRYAMLQLLAAVLLLWALYGRRQGAPVPLPESEPVTRASRYAVAMGGLFYKADKPQAAQAIIADDFRRALVQRLGMSVADNDEAIAARAAALADLPPRLVERLLQVGRTPLENAGEVLVESQQMETVLRTLDEAVAGQRARLH